MVDFIPTSPGRQPEEPARSSPEPGEPELPWPEPGEPGQSWKGPETTGIVPKCSRRSAEPRWSSRCPRILVRLSVDVSIESVSRHFPEGSARRLREQRPVPTPSPLSGIFPREHLSSLKKTLSPTHNGDSCHVGLRALVEGSGSHLGCPKRFNSGVAMVGYRQENPSRSERLAKIENLRSLGGSRGYAVPRESG